MGQMGNDDRDSPVFCGAGMLSVRRAVCVQLLAVLLAFAAPAGAQERMQAPQAATTELSTSDWLLRMHKASRRRAYMGTLVVSAGEGMSSSRIWHVCDGENQIERVESLSGERRTTFRRNDEVITFVPDSKTAILERRESLGLFPSLLILKSTQTDIDKFYVAHRMGSERVAGFDADVVQFRPTDDLRFGYRAWSEKRTGLILKLQFVNLAGKLLEQVAFSELQLDAPVSMDKLADMMADTRGYRLISPEVHRTSQEAEGWTMAGEIPGFKAISCHRRNDASKQERHPATVQCVFSDGLATVSLFIESYEPGQHVHEGAVSQGATHALFLRKDVAGGSWWLSLVGEVPAGTLDLFAQQLQRLP